MEPVDVQKQALEVLEDMLNMRLGLSSDEADYDLSYIGKQLAQCGQILEQLSDYQLQLTKTILNVTCTAHAYRQVLRLREQELKASEEYSTHSREAKAHWLNEQLESQRKATDAWNYTSKVVSEVREAVGDRVQMMKRLDSDIRLHQKLLEAKVASGAVSPTFKRRLGGAGADLDID